jgi:prepilin-type N-terminal cleavage/methylation domain-containing protein
MSHRRAFTLVEMLVVIGIVAVLAALLLPAVMMAVNSARRAAQVLEVNQLSDAIEAYRKDKGDYPPNFRDADAFVRHVRRCYPKIAPTELAFFITTNQGQYQFVPGRALDEGESLVFWLTGTREDPRYPFGVTGGQQSPFKKYYDFDERRFGNENGTINNFVFPSFHAKYSKDTYYIYIDSRSYLECAQFTSLGDSIDAYAYAEDSSVPENCVRPYWSTNVADNNKTDLRQKFKPENPTSFQIICAGLDGDFGWYDGTGARTPADANVKFFPQGDNYKDEDNDNITNFSEGRLEDKIP